MSQRPRRITTTGVVNIQVMSVTVLPYTCSAAQTWHLAGISSCSVLTTHTSFSASSKSSCLVSQYLSHSVYVCICTRTPSVMKRFIFESTSLLFFRPRSQQTMSTFGNSVGSRILPFLTASVTCSYKRSRKLDVACETMP